jgi:hypothetical protein
VQRRRIWRRGCGRDKSDLHPGGSALLLFLSFVHSGGMCLTATGQTLAGQKTTMVVGDRQLALSKTKQLCHKFGLILPKKFDFRCD